LLEPSAFVFKLGASLFLDLDRQRSAQGKSSAASARIDCQPQASFIKTIARCSRRHRGTLAIPPTAVADRQLVHPRRRSPRNSNPPGRGLQSVPVTFFAVLDAERESAQRTKDRLAQLRKPKQAV
jgi:hypothetical protein